MKNLFFSILMILPIITMNSCREEKSNELNSVTNVENSNVSLQSRMGLTNPLEYVGIEHNVFMKKFTDRLESSYQNGEWNNITFSSPEYQTKFSSVMNDAFHDYYPETTSTIAFNENIYNQMDLNEWFDGDRISYRDVAINAINNDVNATQKDKLYATNLLNDVFDAINNTENDTEAFSQLDQIIARHETIILSEKWNDNEQYALGALAVAKYSTEYWRNYNFAPFLNPTQRRSPRNSAIVGADIGGYIAGGIAGSIGGSILGPAGTFGGFIGGKIVGGFTASSITATAFAIYDAFNDR